MDSYYVLVIVVIILLIYAGFCIAEDRQQMGEFYEGLWVASDEFCARAKIDGMMLYVGKPLNGLALSTRFKAYLIMYTDNKVIVNKHLDLTFRDVSIVPGSRTVGLYVVDTDKNDPELSEIMPDELTADVSIATGKMTWRADDTTYAEFHKDSGQDPESGD